MGSENSVLTDDDFQLDYDQTRGQPIKQKPKDDLITQVKQKGWITAAIENNSLIYDVLALDVSGTGLRITDERTFKVIGIAPSPTANIVVTNKFSVRGTWLVLGGESTGQSELVYACYNKTSHEVSKFINENCRKYGNSMTVISKRDDMTVFTRVRTGKIPIAMFWAFTIQGLKGENTLTLGAPMLMRKTDSQEVSEFLILNDENPSWIKSSNAYITQAMSLPHGKKVSKPVTLLTA